MAAVGLQAGFGELAFDMSLHGFSGGFKVGSDGGFTFRFQFGYAADQDLDRRVEAMREIGGAGAGGLDLAVAGVEKRVNFAGQRLHLFGEICAEALGLAGADGRDAVADAGQGFQAEQDLHPCGAGEERTEQQKERRQ